MLLKAKHTIIYIYIYIYYTYINTQLITKSWFLRSTVFLHETRNPRTIRDKKKYCRTTYRAVRNLKYIIPYVTVDNSQSYHSSILCNNTSYGTP